ncbi:blood vessel epicardial substance-like [Diaphorina citri]|uniref:Blood vessel epicardial substance-like n=1 Tax=Diaphorina citri TaxID=121845 RepID=A0A3Q0IVC5_DIACI|nr:blood vessel epicardial substance-like [Diaphorina citri]
MYEVTTYDVPIYFIFRHSFWKALFIFGPIFIPFSSFEGLFGWCHNWKEFQHWLFNTAHLFFFISYALPTNRYGLICMHTFLIVGFSFLSSWAWRVACAPDIFIWNLFFISINLFQLIYVLYQSRPVKFDPDFEEVYTNLFEPFKVSSDRRA